MTFNPDSPLNRIPGESRKANQALRDYYAMGVNRSIRGLFEIYGKQATSETLAERPPTTKISTLWGWSKKLEWQNRVSGQTTNEQEAEDVARLEQRELRRKQLEDSDWAMGQELRQRVKDFLKELPKFVYQGDTIVSVEDTKDPITGQPMKIVTRAITTKLNTNLSQLANALKAATELQRLAIGEATQRTEVTGTVFNIADWREKRQSRLSEVAEMGDSECGT